MKDGVLEKSQLGGNMSANVYWESVKKDKHLKNVTSSVIQSLKNLFGDFPIFLSINDCEIIKGMASVYNTENIKWGISDKNPYTEILEILEKNNNIRLHIEY